jgi:dTDP-4-dehydrorhamnose 3,5-epimerase-like enzyme
MNDNNIQLIELPIFKEENGDLVVVEGGNNIPFQIARIFTVRASDNNIRGQHAHKACAQFLICSTGAVQVNCDNGVEKSSYLLKDPNMGLLIPPGVWSDQVYINNQSVLTVLCDRPFEVEDYIRNYKDYLIYKNII